MTRKDKFNPNLILFIISFFIIALILFGVWYSSSDNGPEIGSDDPRHSFLAPASTPFISTNIPESLTRQAANHQLVLLGESSHGTSEYYEYRGIISLELIKNHGFRFIAVEGDWHSINRLNHYLTNPEPEISLSQIMTEFTRWPHWLWANQEFKAFISDLRDHNQTLEPDEMIRVFGLDVYGATDSLEETISYLNLIDPSTAAEAEAAYTCLESFAGDWQLYSEAIAQGHESCQTQVVRVVDLIGQLSNSIDHQTDSESLFQAQHNALVVQNAEAHFRTSVTGGADGWNTRARHMKQVISNLKDRYDSGIVWAHNTHVGDARATPMRQYGQVNIGQLTRQNYGSDDVYIIGFATSQGEVIAGFSWGDPPRTLSLPVPPADSLEYLLAGLHQDQFVLDLRQISDDAYGLSQIPHRAKGVVYNPDLEFQGNYVPTDLTDRYDALIYIHQTSPLTLL